VIKIAIFDKLRFWKKKPAPLPDIGGGDDLGLPPLPGEEGATGYGAYGAPIEPAGYPPPAWMPTPVTPMQHAAYQPVSPQEVTNKDLEIISAKLDSIRANLDAINQRLANLERVAYAEKDKYERIRW